MIKKLDIFIIAGITVKTTNQNNQAQKDIGELWNKFYAENIYEKIPNKMDDKIYAIYTDYEGDYTKPYRLIIGCAVADDTKIPTDLFVKKIPVLSYEVFPVSGKFPNCLISTWNSIWQSNLNRAYVADLEIYPKNFDPNDAKLDIYISIR